MRSGLNRQGDTSTSEMESHLLELLEKVQAGEIYFLATTATQSNGVIEQRHLRWNARPASGRRFDRY